MPKSTSELMMLIANITAIIAMVMIGFRIRKYIEDRVQDALSKDEVIKKISLLVKPDMVFDESGAIIIDRGACAFIQNGIQVTQGETFGETIVPTKIKISFSKNLLTAPLLTVLDPENVFIEAKRGTSHDWIFDLDYSSTIKPDDPNWKRRYRLEILY